MRSQTRHVIAALLLLTTGLCSVADAELVPIDEAQRVADNFVQMMIEKKGVWAGRTDARAGEVVPFLRADRLLGYVAPVEPVGYVLVAAYREMEPVSAFSMRSNLDLEDDTGPTDALKMFQEEVLDAAGEFLGRSPEPDDDFHALMEVDARGMWVMYLDPAFSPQSFREPPTPPRVGINYEEGDTLLVSNWGQQPPYNNQCPDLDCPWPQYHDYNSNARVGCGSTAGSQIARYFNWPPRGTGSGYDHPYVWANMPDKLKYWYNQSTFFAFVDGDSAVATQEQIDATALICRKVGVAMESDYGCSGTSVLVDDIAPAFPGHFRYDNSATTVWRSILPYETWVDLLVLNFEGNCPIIYYITDHFIVMDGYDVIEGSYYFHIIYGHNGSDNDGWWGIGSIPGGGPTEDQAASMSLYPENTVLAGTSGYLSVPSFPYRYLLLDVYVDDLDLEFAPGHSLQVVGPGLLLENTDTGAGAELTFSGVPGSETVIFQEGDPEGKTRVVIHDAEIQVHEGGQIVIH